jgi:acetyl-CoA acetyltransferase
MRHPPALVSGAVWGSGHTLFSNHRGDLTVSAAADASARLWAMAGLGPSDVDVACIYDAFTSLVLLQLEDYGFCPKGDGAGFYTEDSLLVNPHGGHLSEGYVHGLNHVAAAVEQLRRGKEVALSTGQCGFVAGSTSALVLRRDA